MFLANFKGAERAALSHYSGKENASEDEKLNN